MTDTNYVVKISTALSNKPLFVRIADASMGIDRIFTEAIDTLKIAGKPFEAQQLAELYKQHQIFNEGKVIQKGDAFKDLTTKDQTVGNQTVKLAELDLISSHHGGSTDAFFDLLFIAFEKAKKQIVKLPEEKQKDQIIYLQATFIDYLKMAILHPHEFQQFMHQEAFHKTMFPGG